MSYMYIMHFDHVHPTTSLSEPYTTSSSQPHVFVFKLITHGVQLLLPIWAWVWAIHWGVGNLPAISKEG